MNPNAPSWGNPQQPNNNQQQQQQQQFYQAPQQQQYNPYVNQTQQQTQYNQYAQQQFIQPQAQPQPQQYNPYIAQQQQQMLQQQQQQRQQQYYNYQAQQQQFNNNNNQTNQQFNSNNNIQNQNKYVNNQNNNNNNGDNWDSPDEQTRPQYGSIRIQSKQTQNQTQNETQNQNQNQNRNDLDKSDDDSNNNKNNANKKKKKRRRGGRNKNKNKNQTNQIQIDNKANDMNEITQNIKEIRIEPKNIEKQNKNKIETKQQISNSNTKSKSKSNELNTEKNKNNKISKKIEKIKVKPRAKQIKADKEKEKEVKEEKCDVKKSKKSKTKKVKWDAHDPREHLNLVLIGHVDAGKSTISGQILLATNQIDTRTIAKYKKEAKEKNRESWWIAYIMDEDDEERNKGKTVECGRAHFDTTNRRYTILDAPGHKNYVPNMISGAQQADVAILVISARRGEFEAGFDRGGQTREHALLALTLGISRMVIVVNKMDTMQWSKQRYDDINTRVTSFLSETGFKKKYIDILPISGQDATNIKNKVSDEICPWYNGNTLIETLDALKKVKRATGDALRIPILDRYKGDKGIQAIGKVEAGIIKKGDNVLIMPSEVATNIVGLAIDDEPVDSVGAGENILITFDKGALSMDQIYSGCVVCDYKKPTKVVERFLAEIYIHEIPGAGIMTKGYQAMLHSHNVTTLCQLEEIPHKLHKKTRKKSKIAPHFLRSHDSAIVKIKIDQKCALEPFEDCGALGRFTLRDRGKTVVIGKIIQIFASKSRLKNKQTREYKSDK